MPPRDVWTRGGQIVCLPSQSPCFAGLLDIGDLRFAGRLNCAVSHVWVWGRRFAPSPPCAPSCTSACDVLHLHLHECTEWRLTEVLERRSRSSHLGCLSSCCLCHLLGYDSLFSGRFSQGRALEQHGEEA